MWRKISLIYIIIFNSLRLPIIWLLSGGNFKYSLIEMISPGTKISVLNKGHIEIGNKALIESGTLIKANSGGKLKIHSNVYINRNCTIVSYNQITIGKNTSIGPNVCIYDHNHKISRNEIEQYSTAPINIGENVWIGAAAIILKGVSIGNNSVIGAGTIVTKDIPENNIITMKQQILLREIE